MESATQSCDAAAFLHQAAQLAATYAASAHETTDDGGSSGPVHVLRSPEEIAAAFAKVGAPLPLETSDPALPPDALLQAMQVTLDHSVRTGHGLFLNQLYKNPDPAGLGAAWLLEAVNTNSHTFEVAPALTLIERACLNKLASIWLDEASVPRDFDGLFVPGGSFANLYGMLLARHRRFPEVKEKGLFGLPRMVAFCSDEAHYSYAKSATVLGLGRENLVKVATDKFGAMLPEALEAAVNAAKADGAVPFLVCATAGTTVFGAYDPLPPLAAVASAHGLWLHVDASWGGAALLSAARRREGLVGVELADSLAWNPHKMMNIPLACSVFLTRHQGLLANCNASNAAYLFQPDKNNGDLDLGDRTICCGRKADAFKLWLAWKAKGDAGWAAHVDRSFQLADYLEAAVRASEGAFVMVGTRQCTNVCFWYVPPRLRPLPAGGDLGAVHAELHRVAPMLKDRMQRDGDAMIGFQPAKGLPNFFRCVFAGPHGLSEAVIDGLLQRMDALGKDL